MRQRLVVLNYHQVPEQADSLRPDQVDRHVFRQQLKTLKYFFNVVDLDYGVDAMRAGNLPPRAVAITFDDGYRDNHDVALEELLRAQCPATFFIATDYLDGGRMWNDTLIESIRLTQKNTLSLEAIGLEGSLRLATNQDRIQAIRTLIPAVKYLELSARQSAVDKLARVCEVELPNDMMMSSLQIKSLAEAGMGIGGHTSSHPILLKLPLADAVSDIIRGRDALTQLLGKEPRFFAYPNGKLGQDFSYEHTQVLPELGFDAAFTTQWGYVNKELPSFELPRVGFCRTVGWKLTVKVLRSFFDSPVEFAQPDQLNTQVVLR